MSLPVLFQFDANAESSNIMPIQSSCTGCTGLVYVQSDRFTCFERLDNENMNPNVVVMRDATSGVSGVQFVRNVQPVRGNVLMTQMSDEDRPGRTISDTMTSILLNEKARCTEMPACLDAYDRESSRRRLLNTNTNELHAASRHILAFSSPDITSPVVVAAVCETVVSDTRDCRCVMGFTPRP